MIENNGKTITINTNIPEFAKASIGVECLICEQNVLLTGFEKMMARNYSIYKVCDKCKQAVMKMRETIEHEIKENSVKLKIEIWQYHNIVDTYENDNIEEILNWFRKHWRCCYNDGGCDFEVYQNGKRLSFHELYELGFND